MILVDWQIRKAVQGQEIIVDPFDDSLINPHSMDFRLGESISFLKKNKLYPEIRPESKDSFNYSEINIKGTVHKPGSFTLQPRQFCIASMLENITLASHIMANVRGKSSLGRLGIMQSSVAGLVDGGWSGILTIELFNYSNEEIVLTYGMKIGQLTFERTDVPTNPYGVKGRYQNQTAGMGSLGL